MDKRTPTPEEFKLLTEEEPRQFCIVPDCPRILRREGCYLCYEHEAEVKRKLKRIAKREKAKEKTEMNRVIFALELKKIEAKHQGDVSKLREIAIRNLQALPAPSQFGYCLPPPPVERFALLPPPIAQPSPPPPVVQLIPPVTPNDVDMEEEEEEEPSAEYVSNLINSTSRKNYKGAS
jgi:hypothetical protein